MLHYKRARAGRDIHNEKTAGEPSGHGRYGVLDDDGATVLCHECGERRATLGTHLRVDHGLTARSYKIRHGLPLGTALSSEAYRAAASLRARERLGTEAWRRFEEARDPVAASLARDVESLRWAARMRADGSERNLPDAPVSVCVCQVCGATWCPMPGRRATDTCSEGCWRVWQAARIPRSPKNPARDAQILARVKAGERRAVVAREFGVSVSRIGQIVRRLGG